MIFLSFLLSLNTWAAQTNTYLYQAQILGSQVTCAQEADALASRFEKATGVKPIEASCRGEQLIQNAKSYRVALLYKSQHHFQSHFVTIGKRDLLDSGSSGHELLYPTLESCVSDLGIQTENYEKHTGLTLVAATCQLERGMRETLDVSMRLEGLYRDFASRPQQHLFHFAPENLAGITLETQTAVKDMLLKNNATIVRQSGHVFAYYRAQSPAPISSQTLAYLRNEADCSGQVEVVSQFLNKKGLSGSQTLCQKAHYWTSLVTVTRSYSSLELFDPASAIDYPSHDECLQDRRWVLADSRNNRASLAICTLSHSTSGYVMRLL